MPCRCSVAARVCSDDDRPKSYRPGVEGGFRVMSCAQTCREPRLLVRAHRLCNNAPSATDGPTPLLPKRQQGYLYLLGYRPDTIDRAAIEVDLANVASGGAIHGKTI